MLRTIISLLLIATATAFGCQDAADDIPAPEAVPVELPATQAPTTSPAFVTIAGTVRVFGQEEVALSGVNVCEETTQTCARTDGSGGFELFAPQDTDLVLTATGRDIFESVLPLRADAELSIDMRVVSRAAGEAFVKLADGELSDDTGMVFVTVTDETGAALDDMWMTIRDFAAWGPVFTEPGIVPALGRKSTAANGFGAYLELPVGDEEIGVGGGGRECRSRYLPRTDEGLFRIGVRPGTISWLHVVCD